MLGDLEGIETITVPRSRRLKAVTALEGIEILEVAPCQTPLPIQSRNSPGRD